jgi:hypothetical protein
MPTDWTPEQIALYRQLVAIIYGNLPADTPATIALALAKQRALLAMEDPELFP